MPQGLQLAAPQQQLSSLSTSSGSSGTMAMKHLDTLPCDCSDPSGLPLILHLARLLYPFNNLNALHHMRLHALDLAAHPDIVCFSCVRPWAVIGIFAALVIFLEMTQGICNFSATVDSGHACLACPPSQVRHEHLEA